MSIYREKLKDPRWHERRIDILYRDACVCADCYEVSINNHVHHIYYESGLEPWEYPDIALITLCKSCHEREHGYIYADKQVVEVPLFLRKEGIRPRDLYTLFPCLLSGEKLDCCDEIVKEAFVLRDRRNLNHQRFIERERRRKGSIGNIIDDGWV